MGVKNRPDNCTLTPRDSGSESDRDSGLGTPLPEREISPFSNNSPAPARHFNFDSDEVFQAEPELRLEKRLGDGSHGTVYKVATKDDNGSTQHLAFKTFRGKKADNNEFRIMQQLKDHPFIVKCHGEAEIEGESGVLFEFVSGPSFITLTNKLISTPMPVGEFINTVKYLEHQKLEAVAAASDSSVVHADLKPSNILLDTETGTLKLIDFGQGCLAGENHGPGHIDYAPPETLQSMGVKSAGPKADTTMDSYSLGQMLYQTITGAADGLGAPYMFGNSFVSGENHHVKLFQTVMAMQKHLVLEDKEMPYQIFPDNPDFLEEQALKTEQNRLGNTDEQAIQASARQLEPELKQIHSLINGLMQLNPKKRMTARDALKHPWFKINPANPEQARETLKRLFP